jgi:hypothetical protein
MSTFNTMWTMDDGCMFYGYSQNVSTSKSYDSLGEAAELYIIPLMLANALSAA